MSAWPWHDAGRWAALLRGDECPLCQTPAAEAHVCDLAFSRVIAPERACLAGYVCLIARRHVVEWRDLSADDGAALMSEIRRVSAAVADLTSATKMNILSLGNVVPHLHTHICPRRPNDRFEGRALDPGDVDRVYTDDTHTVFVAALRQRLAAASSWRRR
ncbi:MAG: HIT domain-containing protein [Phycisphaerales bacterium]|nr:HIT domain-containing protein [Phycisphaerales bacterium]